MDPSLPDVLPQTIVLTAIALQVLYGVISYFGLIFIRSNSGLPNILIPHFFVGIFFLIFSKPFLILIEPLIPITSWSFTPKFSIFMFFLTNITFLIIIIESTGKMLLSIYTPAISVLPVLAIFLHESIGKIVFYTIVIAFYFFINIFHERSYGNYRNYDSEEKRRNGVVFISILSLIMSIVIGAITK